MPGRSKWTDGDSMWVEMWLNNTNVDVSIDPVSLHLLRAQRTLYKTLHKADHRLGDWRWLRHLISQSLLVVLTLTDLTQGLYRDFLPILDILCGPKKKRDAASCSLNFYRLWRHWGQVRSSPISLLILNTSYIEDPLRTNPSITSCWSLWACQHSQAGKYLAS